MMTPDPQITQSGTTTATTASRESEDRNKSKTRETMEQARKELKTLGDQAREQAMKTGEQAKHKGKEYIVERKNKLGDEFHLVGDAVRRAGEELRREGDDYLSRYTEVVADSADRAAGYLWNHDVNELARDVQNFTRRHPEIVFGALFIAGLAAARFIKASVPEPRRSMSGETDYGMSGGSNYSGTYRSDYPGQEEYSVGAGEAGTTYQAPEVYPGSTQGRV